MSPSNARDGTSMRLPRCGQFPSGAVAFPYFDLSIARASSKTATVHIESCGENKVAVFRRDRLG
jgi:hypothetical protein